MELTLSEGCTLAEHPFPDVRRAVEQSDALRIAEIEKPNAFEIHEIHFLQIEDKTCPAADDLGFHLVDVLTSQLPAQANSRSALAGDLLNLQRHLSWVRCPHIGWQLRSHSELVEEKGPRGGRRCSFGSEWCSMGKCSRTVSTGENQFEGRVLNLYLSIPRRLIFASRVALGILSFAAAPVGPAIVPRLSARAASIISFS